MAHKQIHELKEASESVTEDFLLWVAAAEKNNMGLAVVTFSDSNSVADNEKEDFYAGEELVRHVFKESNVTARFNVYPYFPKNYAKPEQYEKLGLKEPMKEDKSYHLSQVEKDYDVKRSGILLIDHDGSHCSNAVKEGSFALVAPKYGLKFAALEPPEAQV